MAEGWHFLVPLAVIIVGLFWLNQSPEMAAIYASLSLVVCSFPLSYHGRRMRFADIYEAAIETGRMSLDLLMIAAAAGFIMGVLNVTGLSFALTVALVNLGGGSAVAMLCLAAGIAILLGMGMPTVAVYVLLAALVAPSLTEVGIPALAAHLFVLYFGMLSMTTPPVAVAAFAAASIIQADFMKTGLAGVRFGWSAYIVPFLFVWSPAFLMQGTVFDVALACVTATFGIYLVSVGVVGYMTRPVGAALRALFAVAGLALMIPGNAFDGAIWTDVGGFVLGAALFLFEIAAGRRREARQAA
jgi:TRAP-type uncharacterized transport system fused permease subunit